MSTLQDTALNVQRSTRRVLEAVDWSKEGQPHDEQEARPAWAPLVALLNTRFLRKACHQLRMFKLAVQDWTERFWKVHPHLRYQHHFPLCLPSV